MSLYETSIKKVTWEKNEDSYANVSELYIPNPQITMKELQAMIFHTERYASLGLTDLLKNRQKGFVIYFVDIRASVNKILNNPEAGSVFIDRTPVIFQYPDNNNMQFAGSTIMQDTEKQVTWLLNPTKKSFVLGGLDEHHLQFRERDTFNENPFTEDHLPSNHILYYKEYDWTGSMNVLKQILEYNGFPFSLTMRQKIKSFMNKVQHPFTAQNL